MSTSKELLITAAVLAAAVAGIMTSLSWRTGVAFLAAWLVPGGGHMVAGKWKKGLYFFGILAATYVFGMWIAGFRAVSFDDNPFYYVGQFGSGATLLLAKVISPEKAILRSDLHPSWFDPGLLYVCVVGLLNLVIMLNVLDLKRAPAAAASPEPTGSSAADKPVENPAPAGSAGTEKPA